MSLSKVDSIMKCLHTCTAWSLQLLRITDSKRLGTQYATRQITLSPDGRLAEFVAEISEQYIDEAKGMLQKYTSVDTYDGSAVGTTIYKLSADSIISEEFAKLIAAIAQPEMEADPLQFAPQAYVLAGCVTVENDEKNVKLVSMQKPITTLKHKFWSDNGSFTEISQKVLSLKSSIDVLIVDDVVYFLTMNGENLFNMERSYRAICSEKVDAIATANIVTDQEKFLQIAQSGHNPRRFLAFNDRYLRALRNKNKRRAMATKFDIPLRDDKFDTTVEGTSDKIVKLLCNKGMVDPFESLAMEVAGAKKWI